MLKRLSVAVLLALFPLILAATPANIVNPQDYVNDFGELLSEVTESRLANSIAAYESETQVEIAIVTIAALPADHTIETYTVKLFEEWGIGKEKEDNGLLLLIARDNREVRIEVGYGLEHIITDIESAAIIREEIVPAFQAGNYDLGVEQALGRIVRDIDSGYSEQSEQYPTETWIGGAWPFLLYFGFVLFMILASILGRSKSWWAGGIIGAIIGWIFFSGVLAIAILVGVGLIFDYIVSKTYKESKKKGVNPPWWIGGGHHGGGGFGSGGFGGFGGGMSGGGGASGRW